MSQGSQGFQGSQAHHDNAGNSHDLLFIEEVAILQRCSTKTIRRRVRDGLITPVPSLTNRLLFRRADLAPYLPPDGPGQSSNHHGTARDGSDGLGAIASDLAG